MMWLLIVCMFMSMHISASESICETMLPFHGSVPPMSIVSPFDIVTSASIVNQSEILTIKIKSVQTELSFGEFIINARSTSLPYRVLGRFTSSIDGLELFDCDGVDNTATYVSKTYKGDIELYWQAPTDYVGEIVFKATIAQQYEKNWVGIESAPVEIVQRGGAVVKLLAPLSIARTEPKNADLIYEGCGTTKTCFGLPNNCVEQQACQAIGTAVYIDNRFQFELMSNANNVAYVSLALSRDMEMGEDSVMECIPEQGVVRTYSSWNTPRPNLNTIRQGVPQYITSLLNSSFVDGTIYCILERIPISSKIGTEFNLLNENFHFMVAIGSFVTASAIGFHDLGRLASIQPLEIIGRGRSDSIYDGCGTTKTCFGLPNNCVDQQACQAIGTAVYIDNRFQFELMSNANNVAYVTLALSRDMIMGEDSVMECIPEQGIVRTYSSWNTPRPSLNTIREGVPQYITTLLNSSFVDGTIYCKLERLPISSKIGTEFNLLNENFHFMVAIGSFVTETSVSFHDLGRIASIQPLEIIGRRSNDSIYDGCGTTKTCFGLPTDCVAQQSCQAIATAVNINNKFQFELKSNANNVAYVAFGLSNDTIMGDDSVIECIQDGGNVRSYSSWNTRRPPSGNTRAGVPQNIIRFIEGSYVDGTIYCKLEREAVTSKRDTEFNLINDRFHFMVAIGSSLNDVDLSLTRHDLGRIVSLEPLEIIGDTIRDPIYEGCGTNKTCFGFPDNCVERQSCQAIGTAVFIDNRFQFELKSSANNVAYVALGLSRDTLMGEDSVMECLPEQGIVRTYSSWNTPRPSLNTIREGVPQYITTLISSSYLNGTIYCKLERQAVASKVGTEFNLMNENFHFMVAIGSFTTASAIGFHDLGRLASSQPLRIIGMYTDDTIYEDCGETKICFGLPTDCVERRSCRAIATAAVVNNRYEFELQSGVDRVSYISLGLSRDNLMGDDSVIECVQQAGVVRAYVSWNTARPSYGNTREGVQQNITTLLESSFVQGTIYCKVEREPRTIILGNEFDLVNEDFHFLLAIGSSVTGSSVLQHDLGRVGSCEPIDLHAGAHWAKISITSIVVSFLAANYANNLYGL